MNSASGTTPMGTRHWDTAEIIKILRVCADTGVREFRCGDFFIKLGEEAKLVQDTPATTVGMEGDSAVIEAKAIASEEVDIRERQMAEMLIENPFEYEKLLEQGELENATEKHN